MKVARRKSGFTLIEMLVVISILGILAGLAVPALKNLGKSNVTVSAARQLLDDVGRARQLAIANHTTVYMVFVPANFWNELSSSQTNTSAGMTATINLCDKQLSGYAFIGRGTVGDQPGQHSWHYLTPWQNLPEGTFIATNKFELPNQQVPPPIYIPNNANSPFAIYGFITNAVPFPLEASSPSVSMPCIVFDSFGHLLGQDGQVSQRHEYIPLAQGSVVPAFDPSNPTAKHYALNPPSVSEIPPGNSTNSAANIVDIDPLTGRATLEFEKVQ